MVGRAVRVSEMSEANRIAFQKFLISKGADLSPYGVDGDVGGLTLREAKRLFSNKSAEAITDGQMVKFARRLGASVKQLGAFAKVESGRNAVFDTGHP